MLFLLLLFPLLLSAYSSDLQTARKLQVEGRYAEAETLYRQMLETGEYLPRDEAKIYNNLGSVLFEAGRPADAEPFIRRAIQCWEKDSATAGVLKLGAAYNNLGAIQRAKGNPREAEASYRKAMEILRAANDFESLAPVLSNLGTLYAADRARYAEAEAMQREALQIRERNGRNDPQLGNSYSALAQLLQARDRFEESEAMHRKALQVHEATLPARHPQLARDRANLAFLYRTTNRLAEAEAMYLRSLVDFEQSVGRKHPDYATTLNNIAKIRAEVGDRKTAASLYRQAIATWEDSLGADHPNVAAGLSNLADLLRVEHRYEQAAQLLRRVVAIDEAKSATRIRTRRTPTAVWASSATSARTSPKRRRISKKRGNSKHASSDPSASKPRRRAPMLRNSTGSRAANPKPSSRFVKRCRSSSTPGTRMTSASCGS